MVCDETRSLTSPVLNAPTMTPKCKIQTCLTDFDFVIMELSYQSMTVHETVI